MSHLADDVLFLAKDEGVIHVYSFPEDIGVRVRSSELLGQYEFMQTLLKDEREKRFVTIQQYFRNQVVNSRPVHLMLFVHGQHRAPEFCAEPLSPALAVSWLMHEYISQQKARKVMPITCLISSATWPVRLSLIASGLLLIPRSTQTVCARCYSSTHRGE